MDHRGTLFFFQSQKLFQNLILKRTKKYTLVLSILDLKFIFLTKIVSPYVEDHRLKNKSYLHKQNCFLQQECYQTKELRRTIGIVNRSRRLREVIMHNLLDFSIQPMKVYIAYRAKERLFTLCLSARGLPERSY